jgi:hypothetical protein
MQLEINGRSIRAYIACAFAIVAGSAHAGQPLETESARVLAAKTKEFAAAIELQTASDGKEIAVPLIFDYGLTDRLELSLEPVIYTNIMPDVGTRTSGIGDFEATVKWAALPETAHRPAVAFGAELKIPTAKNRLIGTGQADYRGFIAVSRRINQWDWHANAGYTIIGKPAGLPVSDVLDYAVAGEYHSSPTLDWVAEITGHTSATGEAADGTVVNIGAENPLAPELTGSETIGMVGARYAWRKGAALTLGITYDNNNALSIRPGFSIRW